jgi:flagellar biosynthesis protein FlhG
MDLGGANLHLYLGETSLRHTLHDFLAKASPSLKAIMSPTQYGPYLIGGDSGQLGAANIPFARKLKFLKAIRNLEADDVILDLGGDTSYNVLDFFLAADHQLVFTTCDPASYLDAYSFIKTALYRKLVRMFGPESPYRHQKNAELAMIIRDFTSPKRSTRAKSVRELMQEVNQDHPHLFSPLQMAVRSFAPQIVMSMMDGESTAKKVFGRIQDVSQKMLGIQVGYLGNISYQPEIKHSAQSLVPVVARNPKGIFAECIRKILAGLQAQL